MSDCYESMSWTTIRDRVPPLISSFQRKLESRRGGEGQHHQTMEKPTRRRIFILLCGLRKAMVIPAKSRPRTPIRGRNPGGWEAAFNPSPHAPPRNLHFANIPQIGKIVEVATWGPPGNPFTAQTEPSMGQEEKENIAGIDVSRDGLEVWVDPGPAQGFENNHKGIAALVEWLRLKNVVMAVYEPARGYERELVGRLGEAAIRADRVSRKQVRAFARAGGYKAKTDANDVRLLARFGQASYERETLPKEADPDRSDLQDILEYRQHLANRRARERRDLDQATFEPVRNSHQRCIEMLDREIAFLDRAYQEGAAEE